METFDSDTEKIKLIFKQWLRDLVYIFVAVIFTAFLASFTKISRLINVIEHIKDYPNDVTYQWLLGETLEIIKISAQPIAFFLITIFTLSFFYTTLTIARILKIDLMLKKDLKQHDDLHYYLLLVCFNSIFSGLTSYIGSCWLGLNYTKYIGINEVIVWLNFIFSFGLILILKFTSYRISMSLISLILILLNGYWIGMAFNPAIKLLPYPINTLLLFLIIVIILIVLYVCTMWAIRRCPKR